MMVIFKPRYQVSTLNHQISCAKSNPRDFSVSGKARMTDVSKRIILHDCQAAIGVRHRFYIPVCRTKQGVISLYLLTG